jgi:hypothetical protein
MHPYLEAIVKTFILSFPQQSCEVFAKHKFRTIQDIYKVKTFGTIQAVPSSKIVKYSPAYILALWMLKR